MKSASPTAQGPTQRPKISNPEFFRLVESEGIIDRGFIKDLLEEFDGNALDVLATMIQSGIAPKRKLCQLWCDSIGIAHVDLEKTLFQRDVVQKVPERIARMYCAIPVYQMGDTITVATATPDNPDIAKILRDVTGGPVSMVFALPQDIETSIEAEYAGGSAVFEFFKKLSSSRLLLAHKEITGQALADAGGEAVINQLHVAVILYAVTKSASEIRLSAGPEKARIDITVPYSEKIHFHLEKSIYEPLAKRLTSLAGADPDATGGVLHGRILVPTPGKKIDLEFESRPDAHGPAILLQVSTPRPFRNIRSLTHLYLSHRVLRAINRLLKQPGGHILIAGPPKSGKSTLAYAMLMERARRFKKTATIEQSIKFLLPGIDQYQVHPEAGATAMDLLASTLGQKIETLYVQQMETPEISAKIAEAVDSGQFVFSGIKADNTLDALEKAVRLGAGSSLSAILSQHRVARLCDICKVKYAVTPDHIQALFETDGEEQVYAWRGNGCPYCSDSGFSGLIGIHELLLINEPVRNMIKDGAPPEEVRKAVSPESRYTMHYDGIKKVLRGLTTFDEIHRLPIS